MWSNWYLYSDSSMFITRCVFPHPVWCEILRYVRLLLYPFLLEQMDNLTFDGNEDIPYDGNDDGDGGGVCDMPDIPRTYQPASSTAVRFRWRVLHNQLIELCRYLNVNDGNFDLVNTNLFKHEKSKRGAVEICFFDGRTWVSLTSKRTGKFLAKSRLMSKFGGLERIKRIFSIEGELPDLDRLITFAKKL